MCGLFRSPWKISIVTLNTSELFICYKNKCCYIITLSYYRESLLCCQFKSLRKRPKTFYQWFNCPFSMSPFPSFISLHHFYTSILKKKKREKRKSKRKNGRTSSSNFSLLKSSTFQFSFRFRSQLIFMELPFPLEGVHCFCQLGLRYI